MLNGLTSISECVQSLPGGLVDLVDRIAEAHILGQTVHLPRCVDALWTVS